MKGKIAFVLGAAVGYVLGTRAGRERYEQIKRGARTIWGTPPVQRGVQTLKGAAQTQIDRAKGAALQAGKNLISGQSQRPDTRTPAQDRPPAPNAGSAVPGSDARPGDVA